MSEDVKPALTPDEWANELSEAGTLLAARLEWAGDEAGIDDGLSRHALAALCLHGQTFGFTRADTEALESMMRYDATPDEVARCRSLASRLSALLPPEKP